MYKKDDDSYCMFYVFPHWGILHIGIAKSLSCELSKGNSEGFKSVAIQVNIDDIRDENN